MAPAPDARVTYLSSLNDPLLRVLFEARDEAERDGAVTALVLTEAKPLIRRVLAGVHLPALRPEDVADITATVNLRLVQRLQRAATIEEAAITSFAGFVATLTFRVAYQMFRRLSPQRRQLQDTLRYVLNHDSRLGTWQTAAGMVAGRAGWAGRSAAKGTTISRADATAAMLDRNSPASAVAVIVDRNGGPMLFCELVSTVAELWGVDDRQAASPLRERADAAAGPLLRLESREFLAILWEEIRTLPRPQRVALLLNLRDGHRTDALAVLVLLGIASVDQIATVLEIEAEQLADLWSALPLDDRTIASMLGVTRQQVINLRKSGRKRLARRIRMREKRQMP